MIEQGCHYLLNVKFKEISMTFQDLFKKIQDFYQLKSERLTIIFSKQTLLFGFTELADPDNEKQVTMDKSGLAKMRFLFYSTVISKIF